MKKFVLFIMNSLVEKKDLDEEIKEWVGLNTDPYHFVPAIDRSEVEQDMPSNFGILS